MFRLGHIFLKSRLLARLLTLACFFQFAGLNNGTLHSASLSAPVPSQSVGQIQILTSTLRQSLNPSRISQPLRLIAQSSVQWIVGATLRVQIATLQFFSPAAPAPGPFSTFSPDGKSVSPDSIPFMRVQLVALREVWDRFDLLKFDLQRPGDPDSLRRFRLADAGLEVRFRLNRMKFLEIQNAARPAERRVSHASDEDGAAEFKPMERSI